MLIYRWYLYVKNMVFLGCYEKIENRIMLTFLYDLSQTQERLQEHHKVNGTYALF